tara:strand:- start:1027 stop:1272 length:246 start_codon:yes stop_codon:yes gene_type:complete
LDEVAGIGIEVLELPCSRFASFTVYTVVTDALADPNVIATSPAKAYATVPKVDFTKIDIGTMWYPDTPGISIAGVEKEDKI